MSGTDAGTHRDDADRTPRERLRRRFELHSVVVRYEDRPDRCTVYPRRRQGREPVGAWLSADLDEVVSLESMR